MARPTLAEAKRAIGFVGGARGILQGAAKSRAKDSTVNVYFQELALLCAEAGRVVEPFHIYSEINNVADQLSRVHEDQPVSRQQLQVSRHGPTERPFRILEASG